MKLQTKYFLFAVVIVGSSGIWLPIGLELLLTKSLTFHNVPPNITTYFITLLFGGCIDYLLVKIRNLSIEGVISLLFNILFIFLAGLVLIGGAILTNIYNQDIVSLFIGVLGIAISYRIWWLANIDNPNFSGEKPILGGDPTNELANGKK